MKSIIINTRKSAAIGPKYPAEMQLLADLNRFAKERGYDQ